MTYVSFPGLFDKVFSIHPVAFPSPEKYPDAAIQIRWYGIIICLGIILTVLNTVRCAKKEGISTDDVLDYALWVVPMGIIGARVYYVLTSLSEYESFAEAVAIWNGGLAIYGGIIGGALAAFIVSKVKKIKFTKIADAIGASVFIGQMIGRWGNFCNGEAFGSLRGIDLLGKFVETPRFEDNYFLRMAVNSESTIGTELVHPTFLYESIWNLIGFLIVNFFLYKKKKFDGQIILFYMGWYGFGRFFIEGLRTDSLYLGNTGIRISQLLSLLLFMTAIVFTLIGVARAKNRMLEEENYVSQFGIPENTIGIIPGTQENDKDSQTETISEVNNDTSSKDQESTEE